MSYKEILLSEIEKKNILNQYGLLVEQTPAPAPAPTTNVTDTLVVDKKITFKGGYYSASYADFKTNLDPDLKTVQEFLTNGAGKAFVVRVRIGAGESRIPNTDNEKGGVRVDPGYLSNERMNTIDTYITQKLKSFVGKGLVTLPTIEKIPADPLAKPPVSGPAWIGQPFCPKDKLPEDDTQGYACAGVSFVPGPNITNWKKAKTLNPNPYATQLSGYTQAQYIKVKLELKEIPAEVKQCMDNMEIQVNYTDLNKKHKCNSSIYEIKVNGVKLTRKDGKDYASLNNAGDEYDNNPGTCKGAASADTTCRRYNTFVVSPELANKIIGSTNFIAGQQPKFSITATCLNPNNYTAWGGGCHEGAGNIVVKNGKGETTTYESQTPNAKNQTRTLKDINACGKAV